MFEQIVEIISKQLKADPEQITPETNIMEDLGADSLDVVELLMAIEETFGVSVPDEDIPGLRTIKDMADYVESRQA
ncbi:MAG: acyl carrier protein [Oscillospiraceae bacterium]|nr:acyl carrier protein [Oscillospiraceae bacterium]